MLWELNKRMINIVIVHYMLKRHICPCEVLITSAISVWINTEIYHLIQGMKNKTKNKKKYEFRLPLKYKSSLSVVVI